MDKLIEITSRSTPKAQASWFKKHFDINAEYDCNGVIITNEAFEAMVMNKYGVSANDEKQTKRPTVKLTKKHAKTIAA
jgi:spore coat polysaccharide biosynthesis predicted glycosyltransferase SpsG